MFPRVTNNSATRVLDPQNMSAGLETLQILHGLFYTVADPGFPQGAPIPEGGTNLLFGQFKLHENEEILGQRGVRIHRAP